MLTLLSNIIAISCYGYVLTTFLIIEEEKVKAQIEKDKNDNIKELTILCRKIDNRNKINIENDLIRLLELYEIKIDENIIYIGDRNEKDIF